MPCHPLFKTVCLLGVIAMGCATQQQRHYFPLDSGWQWQYQVTTRTPSGQGVHELWVKNTGKEQHDQAFYTVRRTSSNTDYYFAEDTEGIFRAGKRHLLAQAPYWDRPKRYVLKYPLATTTQWMNDTQLYTQEILAESTPSFPMNYQIESMEESVTVPAGTFKHCIRIKGEAMTQLSMDPNTGIVQTVEVTTYEWYAPDAGLIKLERKEHFHSEQSVDGKILIELISLHS